MLKFSTNIRTVAFVSGISLVFFIAVVYLVDLSKLSYVLAFNTTEEQVLIDAVQQEDTCATTCNKCSCAASQPMTTTSEENSFSTIPTPTIQSTVYTDSHLFHVSPNGQIIQGSFFRAMVDIKDHGWDEEYFNCTKFQSNYRPKTGSCAWCPKALPSPIRLAGDSQSSRQEGCISGNLTLGGSLMDDHGYHWTNNYGMSHIMSARSYTSPRGNVRRAWSTQFFDCALSSPIPVGIKGTVKFDGRPRMLFHVNKRPALVASQTRNYVCTRGVYGNFQSVHRIVDFVEHYTRRWKFDAVLVYEIGMLFGDTLKDLLESDFHANRLLQQGKIVLVDLRDDLTRMYGLLYQDLTFFSSQIGQLLTRADCYSRTKASGAEWVVMADFDEYLTFGADRATPVTSFRDFAAQKEQEHAKRSAKRLSVINFRSKWLVVESEDPSICNACGEGKWDDIAIGKFHKEVELAELNNANSSNKFKYGKITDSGKYALRVSDNPRQFGVGTHNVEELCVFGADKTSERAITVKFADAHFRHYRQCANQLSKCEQPHYVAWNWFMFT